jgi:SAM-dependent methyltransferase
VTVFDNSPAQLARDREVSERHGLQLETVEGDMRDLSAFADASFDLVFHPVSNVFSAEVLPVWREAYRVLRPGGSLLAGFMNPALYLFDYERFVASGERVVRYTLPYEDLRDRPPEELQAQRTRGEPLEFSHSLELQIGGQLRAGFVLVGLYESERTTSEGDPGPVTGYLPEYIATRALKQEGV